MKSENIREEKEGILRKSVRKPSLITNVLAVVLILTLAPAFFLCGCSKDSDNKVVIYTSSDENEIALQREMLDKKFPNYEISIEYISTGSHAAKLKAEGESTECDISYDLEYGYMEMLDKDSIYADLTDYDTSIFIDDLVISKNFIPTMRYGGAIIVNTQVMADKGLPWPTSYDDLLKPEYKDLISMPSAKASGTGYMFYKNLVNTRGLENALAYFDSLAGNIQQFASSGSGPVNSLVLNEVAIGIGMTSHAALKMTEGNPLEILFFEEGSPYLACGAAIISGKEGKAAVQEVFRYFYEEITPAICENLYPEQIYKDKTFSMENYPLDIPYADMSDNTIEEKERLLELWKY